MDSYTGLTKAGEFALVDQLADLDLPVGSPEEMERESVDDFEALSQNSGTPLANRSSE